MIVGDLTWPDVAFAAIPTIASVAAAYIGYLIRRDVKTSNGSTIGRMVEQARNASVDNNSMLTDVHEQVMNGGDE